MKAFLFDMDGVLVDTQCLHNLAIVKTFARHGVEVDVKELGAFAGTKRGMALAAVMKEHGVSLPLDELCDVKDEIFDGLIDATELTPIDGIVELLQALQAAHIPAAIASSSSPEFIATVVDRTGIRPYFAKFVSGQLLPESKPNPAIYLLAAQQVGVPPEDCVVLEDAEMGVRAAKAAGMYCIGYRNLNSGKQDLSLADEVVGSIREISVARLLQKDQKKS